jgi:peptidoglycan L-alanyl-D-glutamate endopeptidase CwlK
VFSSRRIDDLAFPAKTRALKFMGELRALKIDVLVTCTFRDEEAQNELYAQGRTRRELDVVGLSHVEPRPGRILTNAKGGWSFHQYKVALDLVPLRHGKPVWGTLGDGIDDDPRDDDTDDLELWQRVGEIAEFCGMAWAGRWKGKLREMAHFQYTGGLTLADFQSGRKLLAEVA